jgi:hypothetical protein
VEIEGMHSIREGIDEGMTEGMERGRRKGVGLRKVKRQDRKEGERRGGVGKERGGSACSSISFEGSQSIARHDVDTFEPRQCYAVCILSAELSASLPRSNPVGLEHGSLSPDRSLAYVARSDHVADTLA